MCAWLREWTVDSKYYVSALLSTLSSLVRAWRLKLAYKRGIRKCLYSGGYNYFEPIHWRASTVFDLKIICNGHYIQDISCSHPHSYPLSTLVAWPFTKLKSWHLVSMERSVRQVCGQWMYADGLSLSFSHALVTACHPQSSAECWLCVNGGYCVREIMRERVEAWDVINFDNGRWVKVRHA